MKLPPVGSLGGGGAGAGQGGAGTGRPSTELEFIVPPSEDDLVPAPRSSGELPTPLGAAGLAAALEDLARRLRTGEIPAPGYRPGMPAEAAIAALLATLLDRRD